MICKKNDIRLITTRDASHTLFNPELNEHYHSTFGAVQESRHVFLEAGFNKCNKQKLKVFEVGFGTGLNTLLTFIEADKRGVEVVYHTIELYPLDEEIVKQLNYGQILMASSLFTSIHSTEWEIEIKVSENCSLKKMQAELTSLSIQELYNCIYFDAFSPDVQPDLWTINQIRKMFDALADHGILVTYSAKGSVRRTLVDAGFQVERIPGPLGKREMLRAIKLVS